MGTKNSLFPELKAHGVNIEKAENEKYLGDIISKDCLNKINIQSRKGKGIGIVSQIK